MKLEWSDEALADLDRFAMFLEQEHPALAKIVAEEIIAKTRILSEHPLLGHVIEGREVSSRAAGFFPPDQVQTVIDGTLPLHLLAKLYAGIFTLAMLGYGLNRLSL